MTSNIHQSLEVDIQPPSSGDDESVEELTTIDPQTQTTQILREQKSWILPLCVSHGAAAWGERSWEFGAGLLLLHLSLNSTINGNGNNNNVDDVHLDTGADDTSNSSSSGQELRLTAILVLLECGACSLLGPRLGHMVDHAPLLRAALGTLLVQSFGIGIAAGSLIWALVEQQQQTSASPSNNSPLQEEWGFAIVTSISFSVVAKLGSLGSTIATEKRWSTLLANHSEIRHYGQVKSQEQGGTIMEEVSISPEEFHDENIVPDTNKSTDGGGGVLLSKINARLRSIDLMCNLCAPILVGFLLEYTTPAVTALVIAAFNIVAFPVEVACLVWIQNKYYDAFPVYDASSTNNSSQQNVDGDDNDDDENESGVNEVLKAEDGATMSHRRNCTEGWTLYWSQPYVRSFLALALLYLSVVGFGSLMTAWLVASGFRPGYVGVARAVAAVSGIGATFVTPRIVQIYGLEGAGTKFIWWMWVCIGPAVLSAFWLYKTSLSSPVTTSANSTDTTNSNDDYTNQEQQQEYYEWCLWVVVLSIILSRFGLWGFDLTVTQLLQECVEPSCKMGVVNGTQAALQNAFDALAALVCVLIPDPTNFVWLILGSFGSVTLASVLHSSSSSSWRKKQPQYS